MNDEPHELMNMAIDEEEEILLITFLDDENTSNVLLWTYDYTQEQIASRILNIKQESTQKFNEAKREFEKKMRLVGMVEDALDCGKTLRPRYINENYYYSLEEQQRDNLLIEEQRVMP